MGWKETAVLEHKDVDAANTRERVARKLDRIAAAIAATFAIRQRAAADLGGPTIPSHVRCWPGAGSARLEPAPNM